MSALETGKTKGITFETLAKLCMFFSCTPNELLELEADTEVDSSPTTEELSLADEIISRGINRAITSPKRPVKEIWAEFDALRAKMATHASIKSDRETETSID